MLHKPITTAEVTEAGCLGVAMLAAAACTGETPERIVAQWVRLGAVVEPNPENAAYYDERFGKYLQLYPAVKALAV